MEMERCGLREDEERQRRESGRGEMGMCGGASGCKRQTTMGPLTARELTRDRRQSREKLRESYDKTERRVR